MCGGLFSRGFLMGSSGGLDNGLREFVLFGVGSLVWCLVGW